MRYRFQVLVDKGTPRERWADVRPFGGEPYEYPTYDEAERMAERMAQLCYGRDPSIVRVVEVTATATIGKETA